MRFRPLSLLSCSAIAAASIVGAMDCSRTENTYYVLDGGNCGLAGLACCANASCVSGASCVGGTCVASTGSEAGSVGDTGTGDSTVAVYGDAGNSTCQGAAPVGASPLRDQDLRTGGPPLPACIPHDYTRVLYYSASLPPGTVVDLAAAPSADAEAWTPALAVLPDCASTTCTTLSGPPSHLFFPNTGSSPQSIVFTVSNAFTESGGTFDVSATTRPIASNATCATAKPIAFGTALAGEDTRAAYASVTSAAGCGGVMEEPGQLFTERLRSRRTPSSTQH